MRTKLIWFSTKIGISKIILEWLFSMDFRIITVSEILPLKQGLKHLGLVRPGVIARRLRDTSIKTRIETP
ncbi:MAG: hypothetical protein COV68_01630, partial [Nitrospirae bacterium CG11_big_fil_rev_8_21_14_0_20_41_14]